MEAALRDAVCKEERLSLQPLGLEDKVFETFAPVLERLGIDEWLVGITSTGIIFPLQSVQPEDVIRKAQATYVKVTFRMS